MKRIPSIKLIFIAVVFIHVIGCSSTTLYPAPPQSEPIAIHFSEEGLSGWFDLPAGVYRVPDSQVIISGHQSDGLLQTVLGPLGRVMQSSINSEKAEKATENDNNILQITLTEAAKDIAQERISQPEFAQSFTDLRSPGSPVLDVKTAVILTFQNDHEAKPYVLLQAAFKDARTNTLIWESRYMASSGPAKPFEGDEGWTANDGEAFERNIAQNLEKAIILMMTDVSSPYPRKQNQLVTVQGFYPYARDKLQIVGYKLFEDDRNLIYQPKLGNAVVFSGVHIMDKSTIEVRPADPDDDVYKVVEEDEVADPDHVSAIGLSS